MKNIIVDLDGVICQYDFPKLIKKHFGVAVLPEWLWCYGLEDSLGLPFDEVHRMFAKEAFAPPTFIDGAISALASLILRDYNVCILSNRTKYMELEDLTDWASTYKIPFSQVITCASLPSYVHVAIDDWPRKLLELDSKTTVKKLLLFQQPWNEQCHNLLERLTFVRDWNDILEEVG